MFELNDRGEVPFHNAVKCAIATLTDKIISSENDLVGVCFYGTVRPPPLSRSAGKTTAALSVLAWRRSSPS